MLSRATPFPAVRVLLLLSAVSICGRMPVGAQTVRAVLFFAPTCRHCHTVITEYLPVLFERHGGTPSIVVDRTISDADRVAYLFTNGQLQILLVDASRGAGSELYEACTVSHDVPYERSGVPRLVIGDSILVGSLEIPEQADALVEQAIARGGLDWPSVAGLDRVLQPIPGATTVIARAEGDSAAREEPVEAAEDTSRRDLAPADRAPAVARDSAAVAAVPAEAPGQPVADTMAAAAPPEAVAARAEPALDAAAEAEAADTAAPSVFESIPVRNPTMFENLRADPLANGISVLVLVAMVAALAALPAASRSGFPSGGAGAVIPVLTLVGAVVASYLTYIEASGAVAVCGPVGDCNAVQQSDYAVLLGVLPVGALGLLGYVAIGGAWIVWRLSEGPASDWARVAILAMCALGTLFSAYLTFLEPFVIGATCVWCLTSSVVITMLMLLSARSGREAWNRVRSAATETNR